MEMNKPPRKLTCFKCGRLAQAFIETEISHDLRCFTFEHLDNGVITHCTVDVNREPNSTCGNPKIFIARDK